MNKHMLMLNSGKNCFLGKRKNGPIEYSSNRNSGEIDMEPNVFENCSVKELIRGTFTECFMKTLL